MKNNIFEKLIAAEFRQPLATNNAFKKLTATDVR
jgi:hypothetical protein